jgi:hypothetical protein
MSDNISKFPMSHWQWIWNKRGKRSVNCVVSGRYLRYGHPASTSTGYFPDQHKLGTPVTIEIMSSNDPDSKDRKICELILTLEELKQMVEILEQEKSSSS